MGNSLRTLALKFGVRSEPFNEDPEGAEQYFTALGHALVLWGRVESHLDMVLMVACNLPASRAYKPAEMPISMKRKNKLMRRLLYHVVPLAVIKNEMLKLLPDMMDAAQDRHVIVHGHWNGFLKNKPLTGTFITRKHRGQKIIRTAYEVDIPKLEQMARIFDSLNTRLIPITFDLVSLHNSPGIGESPTPGASHKAHRLPASRTQDE